MLSCSGSATGGNRKDHETIRMKPLLILNTNAGSAAAAEALVDSCNNNGSCEQTTTSQPGHAEDLARQAVGEGRQRIIVAGGDGTVNEVINGIAPQFDRVELAVVPLGTCNDLARSLGIPADDVETAMDLALSAKSVGIDVARITDEGGSGTKRWFLNASIGGFGGRIGEELEGKAKERWGALAYWVAAVRRLLDLPQHDVRLHLDDRELHSSVYGIAVANGRFVGGGIPIGANALLNDGLLDIDVVLAQAPAEAVLAGIELVSGRQHESDRVLTARAKRIGIRAEPAMEFNADGETLGPVDVDIEVVRRALRVVVGPDAQGIEPDASQD